MMRRAPPISEDTNFFYPLPYTLVITWSRFAAYQAEFPIFSSASSIKWMAIALALSLPDIPLQWGFSCSIELDGVHDQSTVKVRCICVFVRIEL